MPDDVMLQAFADELQKIAAAHGLAHVSKTRTGKKPISIMRLIAKHQNGTWLRKKADAAGSPQDTRGSGADDPGAAQPPKRKGEVPTRGDQIPHEEKLGMKLADAIRGGNVIPFTSGEESSISPETRKPRQPGDVPTQGPGQEMIAPPGSTQSMRAPAFTNDQSAKRPKKGDTPTSGRDNMVDRMDSRDNATTVTGLGQSSTGIGATNSPVEHA